MQNMGNLNMFNNHGNQNHSIGNMQGMNGQYQLINKGTFNSELFNMQENNRSQPIYLSGAQESNNEAVHKINSTNTMI